MTPGSPLCRDARRRVVGGVCAGVGQRLGVDPTLVRAMALVVIAVTNGLGLLAYAALWITLPLEGRATRRRASLSMALIVASLVLLALAYLLPSSRASAVICLVLAGAVAAGAALGHGPRPAPGVPAPRTLTHGASAFGRATNRAPMRRLMLITAGATAGLWALAAVVALMGVPVARIVWPAIALGVIGLALVRAGLQPRPHGRPRALIAVGFLVAMLTLALMLPHRDPAFVKRTESLVVGTEAPVQQLSSGAHTIDLANLPAGEEGTIVFNQQVGSLRLIVPRDRGVWIEASVRAGQVVVPEQEPLDGVDRTLVFEQLAHDSEPTLRVKVNMDVGEVEVVR